MGVEANLQKLGLSLPEVAAPVANYVPVTAVPLGNGTEMIFVSGQISRDLDTGELICGKVGADVSPERGNEAARSTAAMLLAALKQHVGDLDKVVSTVKVCCLINAAPDFYDHPRVANGCSDLLVSALGETAGRHARIAYAPGSLPGNVTVETDAIFVAKL